MYYTLKNHTPYINIKINQWENLVTGSKSLCLKYRAQGLSTTGTRLYNFFKRF